MRTVDFFLARLPIFKTLPPPALAEISEALILRSYGRGEAIFDEGSRPDAVHLLRSGLVKAVKYSPRDEPVTMEILMPGQLLGMIAVMDRRPYPVTAICIHECEAYRIKAEVFDDLMGKHPSCARRVYEQIGVHLRHSQGLRALSKEPADKRIAHILWMLSESVGRDLPIRRGDVAEMAGTTQETAIRVLIDLRSKGLVASRWKRISVLKPARLAALAGQPGHSRRPEALISRSLRGNPPREPSGR